MIHQIKLSFLLATLIGLLFNFDALINAGAISWAPWLVCYILCFGFMYFYMSHKTEKTEDETLSETFAGVNPSHLEALYKQAMIVERNAQKANLVFTQQLKYVKNILNKAKGLSQGDEFESTHSSLVKELDTLEHHLEKLLNEMKKNVKLGEKLQQSVANIDPEIGVI